MKFEDSVQIGRVGEELVYDYICDLKYVTNVINVSNDDWFQQFDIDFILQYENGDIGKIEVKTDMMASKTGNMVYEIVSNKYSGSQGCFDKTQADYIYYYIQNTNYLIVFNTQKLREWVCIHSEEFPIVDMGDLAQGYLIPLRKVKEIAEFKGKI